MNKFLRKGAKAQRNSGGTTLFAPLRLCVRLWLSLLHREYFKYPIVITLIIPSLPINCPRTALFGIPANLKNGSANSGG
jgi:hypothetical protein